MPTKFLPSFAIPAKYPSLHLARNYLYAALCGVTLGVLFWVVDAFLDGYAFGDGAFRQLLLQPNPETIWPRLFVLVLSIASCMAAAHLIVRARISERKRLEAEALYRQIVETMNDGLIMIDKNMVMTYLNNSICATLGYLPDELLNKPGAVILNTRNRKVAQEQLEKRRLGQDDPYEIDLMHKDGHQVPFIICPQPVIDEKGEFLGSICVLTDITALRQIQNELRSKNDELLLSNHELMAFNQMVSHDLRNPVGTIKGFCQILLGDRTLTPEVRDIVQHIEKISRRMSGIIDELLRLSRLRMNMLERSRVDLSEICSEVAYYLSKTYPDHPVEFHVAQGLEAECDSALIRIALENLLSNAWKYTSRTPNPRVEVGLSDNNGQPVFHIIDNGVGFALENAEDLFRPFYRFHDSDLFDGHGLGLTTVKQIIEMHGGAIWAHSKPGEETRFCFTLHNGVSDAQQMLASQGIS